MGTLVHSTAAVAKILLTTLMATLEVLVPTTIVAPKTLQEHTTVRPLGKISPIHRRTASSVDAADSLALARSKLNVASTPILSAFDHSYVMCVLRYYSNTNMSRCIPCHV
ncbi:hypothetical protein NM688_g8738 [Phlebia brevispora]|uniref:Uncharacterized protein n=1 Tax=Phlebia brevispora TaxID=194682 RepID=A0ACC1RQJ1_9APHY|nr:hypothetical protein NM688_g8738 [Phlebia brevispora]